MSMTHVDKNENISNQTVLAKAGNNRIHSLAPKFCMHQVW